MKIHWLYTVASTNTYVKEHDSEIEPETMLFAFSQTAGRGQRGNGWESEPGQNLTFSFYFTPRGISPADQFVISEAVALAVVKTLSRYGIRACVKWPNDIYVGDKKICGILIENSITASEITKCIVGVGLNVNQEQFVSDAPNPVSMVHLLDRYIPLGDVVEYLRLDFDEYLSKLKTADERRELHAEYLENLWRGDGREYQFIDSSSNEEFMAAIHDVELTGFLHLRLADGTQRRYAFKEVGFVL